MSDDPPLPESKSYSKTWKSIDSVRKYAESRYKNLDQWIVSLREIRLVDRILKNISSSQQTLLDIPTGYGRFTQTFLEHDLNVSNADLNLYAAFYQREQHHEIAKSLVANVFNIPFPDNSFDIVFNFRLLQHMKTGEQRHQILKELNRVTRNWAIVSTYIHTPLHSFQRRIVKRPRRIFMASPEEWQREVEDAGFNIQNSWWIFRHFHAHKIFLLKKIS